MWLTVVSVPVLLSIAVCQFYLFVTFKGANGGKGHLWLSISTALLACIIGFLVFMVFIRYVRKRELHIT